MFPLRCTVRNCTNLLQQKDRALICEAGHHFDQAKQGYWNLLQPQDKKSLNPGDNDEAVLARHRWLQTEHMHGLVEALRPWVVDLATAPATVMDLGCGEGSFGKALFEDVPATFCGIDLSRKAIRLAIRQWSEATWVLANADRMLPAADQSVDCVVSLFGRRPASEVLRVLKCGGRCIVAVPGERDLIELRERAQGTGAKRSRWEAIVEELTNAGLELVEHKTWQHKAVLQPDEIRDALTMTYRAVRHSEQQRLKSNMTSTSVTLEADLMLFQRRTR